jgi:hypothetical protein
MAKSYTTFVAANRPALEGELNRMAEQGWALKAAYMIPERLGDIITVHCAVLERETTIGDLMATLGKPAKPKDKKT